MALWIDKSAHMPRPEDCDEFNCILAWHRMSGAHITTLQNFEQYGTFYTHWMPTPDPPERD